MVRASRLVSLKQLRKLFETITNAFLFKKVKSKEELQTDLLGACKNGDLEFLRKFTDEHREPDEYIVVDENGWGPLHHAVTSNKSECVELLLSTHLVDICLRTKSSQSCLDVAVECDVSSDIIRLLLHTDTDFRLLDEDLKPLRIAIKKNSLRMVETVVDTLKSMHYLFLPRPLELLLDTAPFLHFKNEAEHANSIKIFEKLLPLVLDEGRDDFMQTLFGMLFLLRIKSADESLSKWCIDKWYLTETNAHRDLVRKLLDNPQIGFDYNVITVFHSDIRKIIFFPTHFYENVIDCLLKVDTDDRKVIDDVTDVLWPKVDWDTFAKVYKNVLLKYSLDAENRENFDKLRSLEWLKTMKIEGKFNESTYEVTEF